MDYCEFSIVLVTGPHACSMFLPFTMGGRYFLYIFTYHNRKERIVKNLKIFLKRVIALFLIIILIAGCSHTENQIGKEKTIKFADIGWDSVRFHNAVAGLIAERIFGYQWEEVSATSVIAHEALMNGDIDIEMEAWTDNLPNYPKDLKDGRLTELGINFDDNTQGFYVPRYVIEGDLNRGISPVAPNLKTVSDLVNYPHLFPDSEKKGYGRIYGGITGWSITEIMKKKIEYYNLDSLFTYMEPGTDSALSAAITSAYDKGEPIVAYYWEPTWLMGQYDMVLLKDSPYNDSLWFDGGCECPSVTVTICSSNHFLSNNKEFCEILSKYKTSSALTSEALAYMQKNNASYLETAEWFIQEHADIVKTWMTEEQFLLLNGETEKEQNNLSQMLFEFPRVIPIDTNIIDQNVRSFAAKHDKSLNLISNVLLSFVIGIETILNHTPWVVLLILTFLLGWKTKKSIFSGVLYAFLLFLIGAMGLWSLMNTTLAIVLASVFISLLLGFPIGIIMSNSEKANHFIRPVLDMMQTMPVFVYLIPALLLFGMGYAPAVIATVIYSIVPIIRMTSLGIRQVDHEVVESSFAFGATKLQTLFKVQIPQAKATIMAGINQTLMMAMSMVVTCSMIGARGLGHEVLTAVQRMEIGRGILAGLSVVIIAILLDRMTQGNIEKKEKIKNDK